jgi:hypothetical protein
MTTIKVSKRHDCRLSTLILVYIIIHYSLFCFDKQIVWCLILFAVLAARAQLIGDLTAGRYLLVPATDTSVQWLSPVPYNIPIYYDYPIQQQAVDYRNDGHHNIFINADSTAGHARSVPAPHLKKRQIQIRYRPGSRRG